jgi:flagellar motor protein MotB
MRRRPAELFTVNVWPPFVDAITLVLAAFVLVMLLGAVAQRTLVNQLRAADREMARLKEDKARIEKRIQALVRAGVEVDGDKMILQGEVLFPSGTDMLTVEGEAFVQQLAGPLKALMDVEPDQMVMVGGHTDDVPIHNERFDSNWELSTARAVSVARLLGQNGVPRAQLLAAGFGAHHPRTPNLDETTRRMNRRIEVLLVPQKLVTSK